MFFCSREEGMTQDFLNMFLLKIICVERNEALLWPQLWPGVSEKKDIAPSRRRVIMELVQYLLRPDDSAIVVKQVPEWKREQSSTATLDALPTEIHMMILEYLDDLTALCLSVVSRSIYNKSASRLQDIICPYDELGCWAGKKLVRAGVNFDLEDPSKEFAALSNATSEEDVNPFLLSTVESQMLTLRKRGYYTVYPSEEPAKIEVLRSISRDPNIPKVAQRWTRSVFDDAEYENMFQSGERYVLRNLNRNQYFEFPTGKIKRTPLEGDKEMNTSAIPHPAEHLINAVTWKKDVNQASDGFGEGFWAGEKVDIVLESRIRPGNWRMLEI